MRLSLVQRWVWGRRVRKARLGMTADQICGIIGEPDTIDQLGDIAIWIYHLGTRTGYTHRIAFADHRVCQSYLCVEGG